MLLAIFVAILVAGFFLDWRDQWDALGAAEQVEVGLKAQYAEKKGRAINFDLYVQQLNEVEQSFGALVKQLPNRSEIDALLTDVNQAGPRPRPAIRIVQAGGAGKDGRLLRGAADQHQDHRHLSRHGRVRERHRAAAAHRHAQRRRDQHRQGHAVDGRGGQDVPLPGRGRNREAARGRQRRRPRNETRVAAMLSSAGASLLAGCGGSGHPDLDAWMKEQGKTRKGKLDPLPQIKPYDPFTYNAFDLPDPFKPRKIEPTKGGSKLAPDFTRRKEPLEAYPLESLTMVGTLAKNKTTYALVRTPERDVYQVRAGNYLGQNYGVVIEIGDSELKLKELLQDGAGDWTERSSSLQLQQPADQKR